MTEQKPVLPPYARALGIEVDRFEGDAPILACDYANQVMGRAGFVHGGALSGLLEMAALFALQTELAKRGEIPRLKPVNVSVEFLRGAGERRTYAVGKVVRYGRRLANVIAEAWQDDRTKPVATCSLNVVLAEPKA